MPATVHLFTASSATGEVSHTPIGLWIGGLRIVPQQSFKPVGSYCMPDCLILLLYLVTDFLLFDTRNQANSLRLGGRTAWSATVTLPSTQQNFQARFWYDGDFVHNAKEDAAEVALLVSSGSGGTSTPTSTGQRSLTPAGSNFVSGRQGTTSGASGALGYSSGGASFDAGREGSSLPRSPSYPEALGNRPTYQGPPQSPYQGGPGGRW